MTGTVVFRFEPASLLQNILTGKQHSNVHQSPIRFRFPSENG